MLSKHLKFFSTFFLLTILLIVSGCDTAEKKGDESKNISKTTNKVILGKPDYQDTNDGAMNVICKKDVSDLQKLNGKIIEIACTQNIYRFGKQTRAQEILKMKLSGTMLIDGSLKENKITKETHIWRLIAANLDFDNDVLTKKVSEIFSEHEKHKDVLMTIKGKVFVDKHFNTEDGTTLTYYDVVLTNAKVTNIFSYIVDGDRSKKINDYTVINHDNPINYQDYIMSIPQEKYLRNAFK